MKELLEMMIILDCIGMVLINILRIARRDDAFSAWGIFIVSTYAILLFIKNDPIAIYIGAVACCSQIIELVIT